LRKPLDRAAGAALFALVQELDRGMPMPVLEGPGIVDGVPY
jgi:hypothetical protein